MRTDAQRRAKQRYKTKCREIRITLYPGDADIISKLDSLPQYSPYIKELIRADIAKRAGK